jgi:hypothetical protein
METRRTLHAAIALLAVLAILPVEPSFARRAVNALRTSRPGGAGRTDGRGTGWPRVPNRPGLARLAVLPVLARFAVLAWNAVVACRAVLAWITSLAVESVFPGDARAAGLSLRPRKPV